MQTHSHLALWWVCHHKTTWPKWLTYQNIQSYAWSFTTIHGWWCQRLWSGLQRWSRCWHSVVDTLLAPALQSIPYLPFHNPSGSHTDPQAASLAWGVDSYSSCKRKQGDVSVFITSLSVSFPFVGVNNQNIFKFLQHFFLIPHGLVHAGELPNEYWATSCIYFCWDVIGTQNIATGDSPDGFLYFGQARELIQGGVDCFIIDDR